METPDLPPSSGRDADGDLRNSPFDDRTYVLSVDADGNHSISPLAEAHLSETVEIYPSDLSPDALAHPERGPLTSPPTPSPPNACPRHTSGCLPGITLARGEERIFRWSCGCMVRLIPTEDQAATPSPSPIALVMISTCPESCAPPPNRHSALGPAWIGGRE